MFDSEKITSAGLLRDGEVVWQQRPWPANLTDEQLDETILLLTGAAADSITLAASDEFQRIGKQLIAEKEARQS
jgi:hypothetical protein